MLFGLREDQREKEPESSDGREKRRGWNHNLRHSGKEERRYVPQAPSHAITAADLRMESLKWQP
jgi:hypothetical protein